MASLIRDLAASTPEMLEVFGDAALVRVALAFERELAAAEAAEGLICPAEAAAIGASCAEPPETEPLAAAAAHAGTLAIPLVAELRARLGGHPAGNKAHLGATSQDLADTALMLQAKAGLELIARDVERLTAALAGLAEAHARTPMLGRTLLQPARPVSFGLKAAGWLLQVDAAARRLDREAEGALFAQFGGAVGTFDGLDARAFGVAERLAQALRLACPPLPWHGRRDAVAGLGSALALLAGGLGKMALDIALLAQGEVAEAFEPRLNGRGGSSAMAHKRNPTGCQIARSAAIRAPHLAATLLSALPQEHERGLGGWQAEAPVLAELFCITHGAVVAMTSVTEGLEVNTVRMAANLAAAQIGNDFGQAPALVARALADWRARR
jgi:3-carboxy-cis,cis-muconate cycloisomerase